MRVLLLHAKDLEAARQEGRTAPAYQLTPSFVFPLAQRELLAIFAHHGRIGRDAERVQQFPTVRPVKVLRLARQPDGERLAWESVGRGKLGRHGAPVPRRIAPRDDRLRAVARRRDGQRRAIGLALPRVRHLKEGTFFVARGARGFMATRAGLKPTLMEPRGLVHVGAVGARRARAGQVGARHGARLLIGARGPMDSGRSARLHTDSAVSRGVVVAFVALIPTLTPAPGDHDRPRRARKNRSHQQRSLLQGVHVHTSARPTTTGRLGAPRVTSRGWGLELTPHTRQRVQPARLGNDPRCAHYSAPRSVPAGRRRAGRHLVDARAAGLHGCRSSADAAQCRCRGGAPLSGAFAACLPDKQPLLLRRLQPLNSPTSRRAPSTPSAYGQRRRGQLASRGQPRRRTLCRHPLPSSGEHA